MHEFSIVQDLLSIMKKHAEENRARKIARAVVKVGKLSGVEPHLLQLAFDAFKEKTIAESALLCVEVQDVVVRCQKCGRDSILAKFVLECPECSGEVDVVDGEDLILQSLELEI